MNITNLRKVKEIILAKPKQFNMDNWFMECNAGCIAGCIAGWAIHLNIMEREGHSQTLKDTENLFYSGSGYVGPASRYLEIDSRQAKSLFYSENWPEEYEIRYNNAMDNDDFILAAQIAADRIEHFIATQGEE